MLLRRLPSATRVFYLRFTRLYADVPSGLFSSGAGGGLTDADSSAVATSSPSYSVLGFRGRVWFALSAAAFRFGFPSVKRWFFWHLGLATALVPQPCYPSRSF